MQITIIADDHIRLDTAAEGAELTIDGDHFGPVQMLAASLALCTASVIQAYAETAGLDVHGFAVELAWDYAEEPYRVGRYAMTLHLPAGVPPARHRAIVRAADTCTVHNTLLHPPAIETLVQTLDATRTEHQHHHHAEHHHDHEA